MSYGFQLINNSNEIVVDGSNPCVFLHEQSSAYVHQPWRSPSNLSFRDPAAVIFKTPVKTHEPPFICAHAGSTTLFMGPMIGGPGDWRGFHCGTGWFPRSNAAGDDSDGDDRSPDYVTVQYAVFSREGQVLDPSGYGVQAFNEAGQQIFDSRKLPFILEGGFTYARYGSGDGSQITYGDPPSLTLGMDVSAPSANHWPLLSGLNQMLFAMSGSYDVLAGESPGYVPAAMFKLAVQRLNSTTWRYRFVAILESWIAGYSPVFDDGYPNFGGGMGAVNLRLLARVAS